MTRLEKAVMWFSVGVGGLTGAWLLSTGGWTGALAYGCGALGLSAYHGVRYVRGDNP